MRQIRIFLLGYVYFDCSQLVLTFSRSQQKSTCEKYVFIENCSFE